MNVNVLKRFLLFSLLLLLTSTAFATGDSQQLVLENMGVGSNVLSEPIIWLYNFMKGTGGLLIALISLTCALYSAIVLKSLMGVFLSISVEIIGHYFIDAMFVFFGAVIT